MEGLGWSNFEQRGHPIYAVESGVQPFVRQFIRSANQEGDHVNVEIIRRFMQVMRDELLCGEHYNDGDLSSEQAFGQRNSKKVTELLV